MDLKDVYYTHSLEDLQCNQFMQPLHSSLYVRCIHKKHAYANIVLSNS